MLVQQSQGSAPTPDCQQIKTRFLVSHDAPVNVTALAGEAKQPLELFAVAAFRMLALMPNLETMLPVAVINSHKATVGRSLTIREV